MEYSLAILIISRKKIPEKWRFFLPSERTTRYAKNMEPETVTIEVDVSTAAILRALEEKANAQGVTLDALLRPLVENAERQDAEARQEKEGRTWADVWAELDAMPSDGDYPPDLSTNKKYMEGYGEKAAEKGGAK
jgi:hypothetical protein